MAERVVRVELGARAYDIRVGAGLLPRLVEGLPAIGPGRTCLIVTDANVAAHHLAAAKVALAAAGQRVEALVLPPGERTKSWAHLQEVTEAILAHRLERRDLVVALGGGVIGDLAGFAAAIARRGLRFLQVPTTLLAQVDSSVGGKTGINSPAGKNLVGAFHQPALVVADTALLDTLPLRERRAGYAEIVKYGLIDRPEFFDWLESGAWRGVIEGGPEREEAVAISCAAKAAIVARDETETGDRALLNLGHTFGHAIEAAVGYDSARLVHGEGVAIGMALAFRYSARRSLCAPDRAARVEAHLAGTGLPTRLAQVPGDLGGADGLLAAIRQDKKVSAGDLTFILVRDIGQAFVARGVDPDDIRAFLAEELARPAA